MSAPKVAINGFGRIGRLVLRTLLSIDNKVDIVAINDLTSNEVLAHLFEFDSVHGRFNGSVEVTKDELIFNGDAFVALEERDPSKLPWKEFDVDFVIESTGFFRDRDGMQKHIDAGARQVILTAPAKTPQDVDITIVRGVNNGDYVSGKHTLVSNASCTTNCLATTLKVLDDSFGFKNGNFTSVHPYTNDQRLLDSPHKDFRRMRSAALNMFPGSTGASKGVGLVLPNLVGKIDGLAIRIPTPNVAIVDLSANLKTETTVPEVRQTFETAASGEMKGILDTEWRSLVSIDYNGNPHSGVVDLPTLKVTDKYMLKVLIWYDNEWGYANRTAELVHEINEKNQSS